MRTKSCHQGELDENSYMKWNIRSIILGLIVLVSVNAHAFPDRPLTMLIGFDKGGTLFTQAEVLAQILSETLGQPVFLESQSGLGGGMAVAMAASSNEEGYIFLFTPSFPITDYPITIQSSYDIEDFKYVGAISQDQHAFVTHSAAPYTSWADFLAYARHQGTIQYLSQNLTDRKIIRAIAKEEGFHVQVVPVSGGAGMAPLLLAGKVDLAFSGGTHSRYTDTGEMRMLAALGEKRLDHYPNVPTLIEMGHALQMQAVRLIAVPANTPSAQIDILAHALQRAIQDQRFIEVTQDVIRQPIIFMDSIELEAFLVTQRQNLQHLVNLDLKHP